MDNIEKLIIYIKKLADFNNGLKIKCIVNQNPYLTI